MENNNATHIEKIIASCLKGDKVAQYQLFNQYCNSMFIICNRIIQNNSDAEEVLQDAFVSAFSNIRKLKSATAFGSWLKQIVINRSINYVRSGKKIFFEELTADFPDTISSDSSIFQLKNETITEAVNQLPKGSQIIFILYLIEGYKHNEIAKMLNISVSTSKSQYIRAKSILKVKLTNIINER